MEQGITFITESTGQARPWRVVYSGMEYLGEVISASSWDPAWGRPLVGQIFFRIIFLTTHQRESGFILDDPRIAVCMPRGRRDGTKTSVAQGLRSISEARAIYSAGRGAETAQFRSILGEQEAVLQAQLLQGFARDYRTGRIIAATGVSLDPAAIFREALPQEWIQEIADALLSRAYPHLPLDSIRFAAPLSSVHVGRLFEGLFAPQPSPEARQTLQVYGPGLGLEPPDFERTPLLEPIRLALEAGGGSVSAGSLLERLTHHEGLPLPLATLSVLVFVARNRPAVELALVSEHPLQSRTGGPFLGSRVTWDLLPELAWDEAMAAFFDTLRLLQPMSWRAVLPYAEALLPGLGGPADGRGEPAQQQDFLGTLGALRDEQRGIRGGLQRLSFTLSQPIPSEILERLDLIAAVSEAENPGAFYSACAQAGATPSFVREARDTLPRLRALVRVVDEVVAARQYLEDISLGGALPDLAADLASCLAQFDLGSLTGDTPQWPFLRAGVNQFRQRYATIYRDHHTRYHREVLDRRRELARVLPRLEALERLNTLDELGPPVAPDLPARFRRLSDGLQPCTVSADQLDLANRPVCAICGLSLAQEPPGVQVREALEELEGALQEQNRRLSALAIRYVLQQPDTALVDKFLKVVSASDLAALADVLDDTVMTFLRTFVRQP